MGIFSFLKGLGKEEEIEKEPEDLVLTDIDARINSFSKNVLDNLDQELVDIRKRVYCIRSGGQGCFILINKNTKC